MTLSSTQPAIAPLDLPGIDIVFGSGDHDVEAVFDAKVLKLIGALHRRFWGKRREMLQKRAVQGAIELRDTNGLLFEFGEVIADLRQTDTAWDARIGQFLSVRDALADHDPAVAPPVVRVRGWSETEAGILVDGRAVPGCIVDIAVAMSHGVAMLRAGHVGFVLDIPEAGDDKEARLWSDLVLLAEDRLGIDRGTVLAGSVEAVESAEMSEAAVA